MTTSTRIAIDYSLDGFSTDRDRLMGRHVAGEEFLRALARHSTDKDFFCYAPAASDAEAFKRCVVAEREDAKVNWISVAGPSGLKVPGNLFVPGPNIEGHAWRRRRQSQRDYSIIGITHSTSSQLAMQQISNLLIAPLQPWDALICTSRTASIMVQDMIRETADYLRSRLSALEFAVPRIPVISLGVDAKRFKKSPEKRSHWRQKLGIAENDIAFLYFGRLSFHAKAHPYPMLASLEEAARQTGRKVHLIQAGWFANDSIEDAMRGLAKSVAPSVSTHFVDGRSDEVRWSIWSAADVFTSLSDNIQETFGLTPIEAMAAGLPCVVSDWNGYRDSVIAGKGGFLIPTTFPFGLGEDIADTYQSGLDNYDMYCGRISQFVAVDIAATTRAFIDLIQDDGLRASMSEYNVRRANGLFDWKNIIGRYEELTRELADIRNLGIENATRSSGKPSVPWAPDPFVAFRGYPTQRFSTEFSVEVADIDPYERLETLKADPTISFAVNPGLSKALTTALETALAGNGETVKVLLDGVDPER